MSGYDMPSTFGNPNILFKGISGAGALENRGLDIGNNNALLVGNIHQQQIGYADTEMAARIASTLVATGDDAKAAALYPSMIAEAQARGFLKSAPTTWPGMDRARAVAAMGTPSQTLAEQQMVSGAAAGWRGATAEPSGGGGGGGGTIEPLSSDKATALKQIAQRESGGDPTALNYVAKADPTAYARGATASGKYQMVNSTWAAAAKLAGVDTSKYPTARDAPEAVQDQVASALWDQAGNRPWQKGAQDWVKGADGKYSLQAVAAPQGAAGATATPAPYQVAGITVAPPSTPAAAPVGDMVGPRPLPPTGPGSPVATPAGIANTPVPVQTAQAAPAQAAPAPAAPPAAIPAPPAAPPMPAELQTEADGLTKADVAEFDRRAKLVRTAAGYQALQNEVQQRRAFNLQRQDKYQQQQRQGVEDARKDAEFKQKQAEAAHPRQGKELGSQHENDLIELAPKIADGSATEAEKRQYSLSYAGYQISGQPVAVADPTDPTGRRQVLARLPREVPAGIPQPPYPVGGSTGAKKAVEMSQDQALAATYADRMHRAAGLMEGLDNTAVTWAENIKKKAGDFIGYNINAPDNQRLRQSQLDFLNAVLRKESGAAISTGEYDKYSEQYFPRPGDDAATIRQKQENRRVTIAGMMREAGPGYQGPKDGGGAVVVKSAEDYAKVPAGAEYTDPDGHVRRKAK